jgi:hypothetical protein
VNGRRHGDEDPIDVTGAATMYPQQAGWRGDLPPTELPSWATEPTAEQAEWPTPVEPVAVERMKRNRGCRFRRWFGRRS